jgi:hypothetical protein
VPIAPSIYYEQKARQADPARLSERVRRDVVLCDEIERVWDENRMELTLPIELTPSNLSIHKQLRWDAEDTRPRIE